MRIRMVADTEEAILGLHVGLNPGPGDRPLNLQKGARIAYLLFICR